jgi:stearoyl-CoA desaturase (delta-9 desaturase)
MTVEMLGSRTGPLPLPAGIRKHRILWVPLLLIGGYHLGALLAFFPWFFSWTGVALLIAGDFVFGVLGINLCYHRLLTHRGFQCSKRFEHFLAVLGFCCLQDSPARWVAIHRRHHQHADEQPDPHSPLVAFLWGHMGWIIIDNPELHWSSIYDRYARDVLKDPFYRRMERGYWRLWVLLVPAFAFFGVGFLASLVFGGTWLEAVQFGSSLLVWGVFLRVVVVWHQTWAVNSFAHLWGYRNYATDEGSRNNVFVGLISNGEGWHNNHHADPRSARHGHRRWEIDTTYLTIRGLMRLGLVRNVVTPDPRLTERLAAARALNGAPSDRGVDFN